VLPVSSKSSGGSRVSYKVNEDGSKQKVFKDGGKGDIIRRAK
jgi:hypothetical protein